MESKMLLRLCHVCGVLSEAEGEVLRCGGCGKGFLPLNYFERIKERAIYAAQAGEPLPEFSFNPLKGLVVFW